MRLYCEHVGGGGESFGPVAEVEMRALQRAHRRTSGTLTAVVDLIDPTSTGRAARVSPESIDASTSTHLRLTVRCECGAAFTVGWGRWLDFVARAERIADSLELTAVARSIR